MRIVLYLLMLSFVSETSYCQPKLFEPGLVFVDQSFGLTVSPNGKELFFVRSFGGRDSLQIYHSTKVKGKWQQPRLAPFADTRFKQIDPFYSIDGKSVLYNSFTSDATGFDVYIVYKTSMGWSSPERLSDSMNTNASEFYATISKHRNIYFTRYTKSNDIYVCYYVDQNYQGALLLDKAINTDRNESNPYISKKEDYIIFFADYENGFGSTDLYISFNRRNKWSYPMNLGAEINSSIGEFCPSMDTKNKLFLFSRTEVINGKRVENIYTLPIRKLGLRRLRRLAIWEER